MPLHRLRSNEPDTDTRDARPCNNFERCTLEGRSGNGPAGGDCGASRARARFSSSRGTRVTNESHTTLVERTDFSRRGIRMEECAPSGSVYSREFFIHAPRALFISLLSSEAHSWYILCGAFPPCAGLSKFRASFFQRLFFLAVFAERCVATPSCAGFSIISLRCRVHLVAPLDLGAGGGRGVCRLWKS